ncbi:MAG: DUF3857 domain-containing protein [Deltaproteobacteria bacterium]|nr:DUF3857 domain-containing protein [Deltaproteobacteria bacterium]
MIGRRAGGALARRHRVTGWLALALWTTCLAASSANAQSRAASTQPRPAPASWDAESEQWHAEALRRGSAPEGSLSVIELEGNYENAPERTSALLRSLGAERRVSAFTRVRARHAARYLEWRAGRLPEARRIADELGHVRAFRMLGPFANAGRRGLATPMGPELALTRPSDLAAEVQGAERTIRWRTLPVREETGFVFFGPFLTPGTEVCTFAESFVRTERAEPALLLVGSTGAMRVYWNDALAIEETRYLAVDLDRHGAAVTTRAGWNRLLVKVCSDDRPPALIVRLARPDGAPMAVTSDPSAALSAPPTTPVSAVAAIQTPYEALVARVAATPDDAAANETLARFLRATGGEDPTEHRVRDLATHATETGATVDNLLFAAAQQTTRDDRGRLLRRAVELGPTSLEAQLELAWFTAQGASGERALSMLEAIPPRTTFGLIAQVLRASVLENLGFRESARALRADLRTRVPRSITYLRLALGDAESQGHVDEADRLRTELLGRVHDDLEARAGALARALVREERAEAIALVAEDLLLRPLSSEALTRAAWVHEALGDAEEAVGLLTRATELDPDDPSARVVLGRKLLELGQRAPAIAALREALRLRPQDPETRELVESLEPASRPDESLATPIDQILARRVTGTDHPGVILHDLEVRTVHPTGLSSTFHQQAYQVSTDEGARGLRQHSIRYEPGTQWVDIRSARVHRDGDVLSAYEVGERSLAEPEYRIYYSARDVVVTLPELRVGDVIELRYRVDDVTVRNRYDGHFGALRGLQSQLPSRRVEQYFLVPTSRTLVFNTPALRMQHETRTEGETRIDRFVADDVPPLRPEPAMPGYMEIAPYLHASTFRSWEEVGRFWWGLAETQLTPDAALVRTVRELLEGATDTRTRVARIYAWAIDHVRYVGLEMGIHGHQPYAVSDVVQRGFGDCKDTASLLYAMFQIAGIDARIVLVRTTPLGELPDEPASLAVFNHAIAYVPELGLYLDGTAERTGIGELPTMDQGAVGLVVGPRTVELVRLPILDSEVQGRERELAITLARDGSIRIRGNELLRGNEAVQARVSYGPSETRRARLEQNVGQTFPGISIRSEEIGALTDRETPVRLQWDGDTARFGERQGADLLVAPSVVDELTRVWALLPERRFPLRLGTPFHYRERRVLTLEQGLRVAELPRGGEVTTPFARCSVRYTQSGATITMETDVTLTRGRITREEYAALRRFTEQADALLRARVVVSGLAPASAGGAR